MLQAEKPRGKNPFKPAAEIREAFASRGMSISGISCHCPTWVAGTAWTGSPTIRPFIPSDVARRSPADIEQWAIVYLLYLMDLCAELKVRILPMFWGLTFGWELATGYPWGFWKGADYNLLEAGKERFVKKTARLRKHANELGLFWAHEIHPGTAAMCADDFLMLVNICDGDKCIVVNADPSHCWEGESWETRFIKVGHRVYACHVKNYVLHQGLPVRSMEPTFPRRAMEFVDIPSGDLNMVRYVELLRRVGYPARYRQIMGTETAPLVVEAESSHRSLDATTANGIAYTRDELCFPVTDVSFEEGMGA